MQFRDRGRQDEDRDHVGRHLLLQLLGALPVDVEEHVAALGHGKLGGFGGVPLEIAVHLGPFEQGIALPAAG